VIGTQSELHARLVKAIGDPLASAGEVGELPALEALAHPNCPVEMWWKIAASNPVEAMRSVLYPLMLLATPERWVAMEEAHLRTWIEKAVRSLPLTAQHLFVCECIERVLPIWEAAYPCDGRIRAAWQVRRLFAEGKIKEAAWVQLANEADHAAGMAIEDSEPDPKQRTGETEPAAASVAWAAATYAQWTAPSDCARAVGKVAAGETPSRTAWFAARDQERRWQWQRVQEYLQQQEKPNE